MLNVVRVLVNRVVNRAKTLVNRAKTLVNRAKTVVNRAKTVVNRANHVDKLTKNVDETFTMTLSRKVCKLKKLIDSTFQSGVKNNHKLVINNSPLSDRLCPFFCCFSNSQIC